jgi:phospholipase/lecithinase/hemolysin
MIAHRLWMAAFALCLLVPVTSRAGPYDSIVVFGDSLSDGDSDLALSTSIRGLNPAFPINPFDPFSLFVANAGSFGLSDTADACLSGGVADVDSAVTAACAAPGPNSYPFWDSVHPTTRAQQVPGAQFALAVGFPEPSEMALLFIGLLALVALVRRGPSGRPPARRINACPAPRARSRRRSRSCRRRPPRPARAHRSRIPGMRD